MASIMLISLCAVVSTTSVSAAPSSSRASVKATPDLVGAPIAAGTGPAVCVLNGTTDMYVFVKGNDSALWYRIWSTATFKWVGGWISLGGQLTSSPAAVSRSPGFINAYVRGTDGAVWQKAYYDGWWHNWYYVGGQVAPNTGPAASGWAGREDVFIQGTNGALYQRTWIQPSPTFSNWVTLGGTITSSPAVVSRSPGIINAYGRGTNGALYTRHYSGGVWGGWTTLGGQIPAGTSPAACSWGASREDLFVQGTNGALYQNTWTGTWSGWTSLGGQLSASPTAATFTWAGTINMPVFVRGTNGFIYYKEFYGGSWHDWSTGITGPP